MQQNNDKGYEEYFASIENSLLKPKVKKDTRNVATKKSKKYRKKVIKAYTFRALAVIIFVFLLVLIVFAIKSCGKTEPQKVDEVKQEEVAKTAVNKPKEVDLFPKYDNAETVLSDEIKSESVIFIDRDENKVLASREPKKRMYPASTTKIMTLLVAVQNIKDYNDTFKMTYQITDPLFKVGATVAGFSSSEVLNMNDLIYGAILPSGGDACMALAEKISSNEENFVSLMNEKAKELKLKDTHFTNCTGLFDKNHYTTAEDLAVILNEALKNDICKKVLSTQKYTTSKTPQHPEGIELESTLFKYMYGTEPEGAEITGGKTGFVNESGYCIASFGQNKSGKTFICVALKGESRWPAVYDQINLYSKYTK